jgi:hypothetical protein
VAAAELLLCCVYLRISNLREEEKEMECTQAKEKREKKKEKKIYPT